MLLIAISIFASYDLRWLKAAGSGSVNVSFTNLLVSVSTISDTICVSFDTVLDAGHPYRNAKF